MDFERDFVSTPSDDKALEVADVLHSACGIYTRSSIVDLILDAVDWRSDHNLTKERLLEPASGDGAFVMAAADRLIGSFAAHGCALRRDALMGRILAFEIHAGEAEKGRAAVVRLLIDYGLPKRDAEAVAADWVRTADFLLWPPESGAFTHVVGNPPYLRWSKLPAQLRAHYERVLPAAAAKGDLFLPFLDRGVEMLQVNGKLGFLCTDRWKYMGFADGFRKIRLPEVDVLIDRAITPSEAYVEPASTYPSVVVMQRRSEPRRPARRVEKGFTLNEAGFEVRVGPALGCTDAFVLPLEHANEVEEELLRPWLSPSDIGDGWIREHSRVVICLHDNDGMLRDIEIFPKAKAWLSRYRGKLEQRSIVQKQSAVWYRSIDKVSAEAWRQPKLLVPELSKTPRLALDASGAIPAHGLYTIQAVLPGADIEKLLWQLSHGKLYTKMAKIAPRANGGYLRCYKRFLEAIVLA
ncbi:Eco57I restriction-modification methylase domain-containing protein [Neoaquamicrobium sediminum]|uniref:Eco57I restriction-modification methylase domain-containing protein n=1 Tax=Neoaquamicrobium sediminum TaxID=1849104 RepID=UPI003BABF5C5